MDDPEELKVIYAALDSFRSFRHLAHYNVTHLRRQSFYALKSAHWNLLASPPFSVLDSLSAVDDAIDANADIAEEIFRAGLANFLGLQEDISYAAKLLSPRTDSPNTVGEGLDRPWEGHAKDIDVGKARSTIRQLYRDWSAEGTEERKACYGPVLSALKAEFEQVPDSRKATIRVLVPGAGLGRLVFEIVRTGFAVEGNEISWHQILASSFILNSTECAEQFSLYPWALSFNNHRTRRDQLEKVMIPDVHPATALEEASEGVEIPVSERMGFGSGDFCAVYKSEQEKDAFDAVTTVFFIDTAPNIIAYIETIRNCLKPGGVWINLGPLLWHFSDSPHTTSSNKSSSSDHNSLKSDPNQDNTDGIGDPGSVELTEEEVVLLVEQFGFTIESLNKSVSAQSSGYIQNPNSMMRNIYFPTFWVARKR
ncbi:N2227-domain-containing protein [Patellaria atrata CBS 101060]|uniref:carnosine N-methyltransferase n=1 Tax=Patellaria atrata CBS 101060 TaxID=1346257 RepID=A0A9P4SIE2_9PEZI|nr:N2227-domain-containing protein [Patellaria atrata CBS 101060]